MFNRRLLLAGAGAAAIVLGAFLFMVGREFSGNWVRWVMGPLLWFLGCALVISWLVTAASSSGENTVANHATTAKAVRKAG